MNLEELPGPDVHRMGWLRPARGITVTPRPHAAPSSTRQARVLNPAIIGNPTTDHGLALGVDHSSRAALFHDIATAYNEGLVTSPNVVVLGGLGLGKSELIKINYVLLPLMLRLRRAVVVDKKRRGDHGEGEYSELTRRLGAEPFTMLPGDPTSTCLNPLSAVIRQGGNTGAGLALLTTLVELADTARGPLDTFGHKALRVGLRAVLADFEDTGREPVVEDLLKKFVSVVDADEFKGYPLSVLHSVADASLQTQLRCERLLADDLFGMFSGTTSPHVRLNPKLTTFNISNLPERGPAAAMVIACVNAWLMGMLRHDPQGMRTTLVVEEAWHLLAVAEGMVSNAKLARSLGLSIVSAFHHISDVPAGSDGMALIKEAGTVHLFAQERQDDIDTCTATFGLGPRSAELLGTLPKGEHLFKRGMAREVRVVGVRTELEAAMANTDAAMRGRR